MTTYPQVTQLRGWSIAMTKHPTTRELHWVASRHGVTMNTNTYDGIVQMILARPEQYLNHAPERIGTIIDTKA